ncbi:UNVERIFIED_CONTAM: protein SMAX1-LIKE 3 [Sesamum angustifolium]|uniref:Protein SMAX1-LIKE 3 n=1 Tax=Sesamum angustifolium TaxID=2727405 RepID=A0AAW2N4M2_9LAMI
MRAGGNCAVQQALTADAAAVVKQAVALAKRRGHAQVTPLHVASTMLAASSGLLRVACLQSHSHPLQCKALELCFNVALNRLPASSSSPILGHHPQIPSISNALVAAFKRAQAHQRRGSIENQQQPLLAVKIELEQLIISILDDPSVSRVMREAGFSSTQVKSNVEKAVSLELCSQSSADLSPPGNKSKENRLLSLQPSSPPPTQNERKTTKPSTSERTVKNDDVGTIIQSLLMSRKRKSLVIVGECISNIETRVKELMDRIDKGEVPEQLREVKFISIPPLYSFCNLQRELVEHKMGELTCLVKSLVGKGVVLYLGDLSWISEYRVNLEQARSYYCSVEHMIMELGRLVCGIGEVGRFWLMGIATFQTYMRCRTGYHSLETVWGLHPVTIPADSLSLSLISQSEGRHRRDQEDGSRQLLLTNGEVKLTCCADCSSNFNDEARNLRTNGCNTNEPTLSSQLPPWLKDESRRLCNNDQNSDAIRQLCKKWNSYCYSAHRQVRPVLERTLTFSSTSPNSSSTSCFSFDQQNPNIHQSHFPLSESALKENQGWQASNVIRTQENRDLKLASFSSNPNSPSSSDIMDTDTYTQKFKEFNAQNLNALCNALERKVPWQREIIPEIAGTILQSRSGMLRRKGNLRGNNYTDVKEVTWLSFLGPDARAKEKISRELAKVVFGSYSNLASIGISSFISSTRSDNSSEDCRNKRGRDEESCSSYIERFAQEVSANPHRVFLVEDLEQADYRSQMGVKRAIERGRISCGNGDQEVSFCDAIVVLSCERFRSCRSRACSPTSKQKTGDDQDETGRNCVPLDLNICFDNDDGLEKQSDVDELGILENVDRCVVFKFQDL